MISELTRRCLKTNDLRWLSKRLGAKVEMPQGDEQSDGAVAAHVEWSNVVEEDDAVVTLIAVWRFEQRADEHVVAARFGA